MFLFYLLELDLNLNTIITPWKTHNLNVVVLLIFFFIFSFPNLTRKTYITFFAEENSNRLGVLR